MQNYTDPDFYNCALLTVDMQNDFTLPGAPAEIRGTIEVVPPMARLILAFREKRRPIVHIARLYLPDGSNVDLCRRAMIEGGERVVTPGSEGAELVGELKPKPGVRMDHKILLSGQFQELGPNESIMYKSRWGAFYRTPLEAYLRRRNINTVIVTGCNFPNCPRTSIYEASERDFRVVLVHDAVSQLYERDRSEMEDIGACLLSAQELEKLVDQHQA